MQGDINSLPGPLGVVGSKIQERIKRRRWVRIQQRFPQPSLTSFADGQILPLVSGITKTQLPVPSLEIIAKFPHLTTQPDVEQIIVVSEPFMSGTGVINATKPNAGSDRETASVGKEIWNSRISDCERIPRVHDWHTYRVGGTKAYVRAWDLEWVGLKRHSCQGRIEKGADIFKVGKQCQVFVTDITCE